ncbi:hypothetical protein ACU6P3_33020 (plasmid) [Streptomyces hebeiensis]
MGDPGAAGAARQAGQSSALARPPMCWRGGCSAAEASSAARMSAALIWA